jgi:hypothetical protein
MWFKTRVGYYSVSEPMEIRAVKYNKAKKPNFSIFARSLNDVSVDYIGIIGKLKVSDRAVHLARFLISDSSASEIAKCMRSIEGMIGADAKICDLSAVADEAAWDEEWTTIEW